jgi:hypothetical protein
MKLVTIIRKRQLGWNGYEFSCQQMRLSKRENYEEQNFLAQTVSDPLTS